LKPPWEPGRVAAELTGARCLKPYWGKPTVRNFREGGWKRDYGSRTEAQRESLGIATEPYGARASALPDGEQSPERTPWREARHRVMEPLLGHTTNTWKFDERIHET